MSELFKMKRYLKFLYKDVHIDSIPKRKKYLVCVSITPYTIYK